MNANITDAVALSALRPLEAISYLRSRGWMLADERPGVWSRWYGVDQEGEKFEATVPLNQQFRDFAARASELLRVLELFEGRSQLQIFRDLLVTGADVIRVRLPDVEFADASVPLDEGATFVQKTREMVLAAACAALLPRPYYPSRKPAQAVDYIRRARLGQTEPGSFVLTIISPVSPSLTGASGQLFDLGEPYERRVTHTLAVALNSVRMAAEDAATTGRVESFLQAVPHGVSANLCDALSGMGLFAERDYALDIQVSWSRTRPIAPEANVPSSILLSKDALPVIREAAVLLKESSPREEFEVRGFVTKLEKPEHADTGKITISATIDDQPRKVVVELRGDDYHRAIKAHDQELPVRCCGVLSREGRGYFRLLEAYGFTIEPGDQ